MCGFGSEAIWADGGSPVVTAYRVRRAALFGVLLLTLGFAAGGSALGASVPVTVTVDSSAAGPGTLVLASGTTPTTFAVQTDGGATGQAATINTPLVDPCTRYGSIDGAQWITASATSAGCGSNDGVNQTTTYTVSFELPAGAVNPSIDGSFFADNVGSVALNGTTLASQGESGVSGVNYGFPHPATAPTAFSASDGFVAGTNTLVFTVADEGSVTGLDYSATVSYDLPADLAISVDDGSATAVPGDDTTYTITATNNGPGDVSGATVTDLLTPPLSAVHWTCTASVGSSCNTSGSGNILESVDLLSGGTATFTATGTIDPGALGSLDNTATITAPDGVIDASGNNSSTDSDTLTPQTDLAVTIAAPSDAQVAGDPSGFDYTIQVSNSGPSDNADGYTVTGTLPAGISFDPSGDCTGSGGSFTCSAGSGPDADASPDTYTVHVTTAPSIADGAVLSAVATLSGDTTDTNSGNDQDSADVTIVRHADLRSTLTAPVGSQVAGDPAGFDYTTTVTNFGPSDNGGGYTLAGTLPTGVTFASAKLNGGPTSVCATAAGGFSCNVTSGLAAGASDTLAVHVLVDHSVPDSSPSASVTVTGATFDPNHGNDTASTSVAIVTRADLALDSATAGPTPIFANSSSSNTVTFTVVFHNTGPSDARHSTLKLSAALQAHLTSADWCIKTTPSSCSSNPSFTSYDAGAGIDAGQLTPGSSATVLVRAHGIPTDRNGLFHVTQGFSVSVPAPTTDPNLANNSISANTFDVDTVPSPVRNVQAVAGNGNAIVTFEPPSNTGGQAITQYKVTLTPVGGGSPITVPASAPQVLCPNGTATDCYRINITPLVNGTQYTVDVQAQNAVGLSDVNDGVNPPAETKVTPSVNASASIVAPAQTSSLTTCAVATPTSPTCVQYIIPSGTGGVFGSLGNLTLGASGFPANLCGGSPCIGQGGTANNLLAGAQNLGALSGYNDRKVPLKEIVTWDATTIQKAYRLLPKCHAGSVLVICFPNDVPVYYETSFVLANFPSKTGTLLNLHFCATPVLLGGAGSASWARPKPVPVGPYNGYRDTAGSACISSMTLLNGNGNPAMTGDVQVTINLTSDSDALAGHH